MSQWNPSAQPIYANKNIKRINIEIIIAINPKTVSPSWIHYTKSLLQSQFVVVKWYRTYRLVSPINFSWKNADVFGGKLVGE
jgi:hypothetical protein